MRARVAACRMSCVYNKIFALYQVMFELVKYSEILLSEKTRLDDCIADQLRNIFAGIFKITFSFMG